MMRIGYENKLAFYRLCRSWFWCDSLCALWCKPDKALAGLTAVMWLTLYHNGSTQPVGQSFQADPWCIGEPDQVAGGLRIWNVDDDLRILASVTPLQLTEPPALRYSDDDDNLTKDEPE